MLFFDGPNKFPSQLFLSQISPFNFPVLLFFMAKQQKDFLNGPVLFCKRDSQWKTSHYDFFIQAIFGDLCDNKKKHLKFLSYDKSQRSAQMQNLEIFTSLGSTFLPMKLILPSKNSQLLSTNSWDEYFYIWNQNIKSSSE